MSRGARLKNRQGCWTDTEGFSLSGAETVDADGLHRDRIARLVEDGILEYCEIREEAREADAGITPSDPEEPETEPDPADISGQDGGKEVGADNAATEPDGIAKAVPAPTGNGPKMKAVRKKGVK